MNRVSAVPEQLKDHLFFKYPRIPDLADFAKEYSLPIESGYYRFHRLFPDFQNARHRKAMHLLWRGLILNDRQLQMLAFHFLHKEGVIGLVNEFYRARKLSFQPDLVDLLFLYAHVRRHRPQTIIEYGSGISTVVMAYALEKNGSGILYALESSQEWADSTAASIPERLRKWVEINVTPLRPCSVHGVSTTVFADHPPIREPLMCYIDGGPESAVFQGAENIEYHALMKPGTTALVDSRGSALDYFRRKIEKGLGDGIEMYTYRVEMPGFAPGILSPFGGDIFSNSLVLFTDTPKGVPATANQG